MRTYACHYCGSKLFFENVSCLGCGRKLGFVDQLGRVCALDPADDGRFSAQTGEGAALLLRPCANYREHAVCNGMVPAGLDATLCVACGFTRTIPDLTIAGNLERWRRLEVAKRRLLQGLSALQLPIIATAPHEHVLAFDFLASTPEAVASTGHAQGVIYGIDIREADAVVREQVRTELGERYRTLLGHFRHESGHFFWDRLIGTSRHLEPFRRLFGDERQSYADATSAYYARGPAENWAGSFISPYATMHPWEDWAETWAHYLHLADAVETGGQFGLALSHPDAGASPLQRIRLPAEAPDTFQELIRAWLPLTTMINELNRSMGWPDWYPFVLNEAVLAKLCFVHMAIRERAAAGPAGGAENASRTTNSPAAASAAAPAPAGLPQVAWRSAFPSPGTRQAGPWRFPPRSGSATCACTIGLGTRAGDAPEDPVEGHRVRQAHAAPDLLHAERGLDQQPLGGVAAQGGEVPARRLSGDLADAAPQGAIAEGMGLGQALPIDRPAVAAMQFAEGLEHAGCGGGPSGGVHGGSVVPAAKQQALDQQHGAVGSARTALLLAVHDGAQALAEDADAGGAVQAGLVRQPAIAAPARQARTGQVDEVYSSQLPAFGRGP